MAKRRVEVFSLSFLDVICCGFGAVILFYTIISAQSGVERTRQAEDLAAQVSLLEEEVLRGAKNLVLLRNTLEKTESETVSAASRATQLIEALQRRREEAFIYDASTLAKRERIEQLKADVQALEESTRRLEASASVQTPSAERAGAGRSRASRRYITGLTLKGKRILVLLDRSSSMLDADLVNILRLRNMSASDQQSAVKWQRALQIGSWLINEIPDRAEFQIYVFNTDARALLPETAGDWLPAKDLALREKALTAIFDLKPEGGTSLINALQATKSLPMPPDRVSVVHNALADVPWRSDMATQPPRLVMVARMAAPKRPDVLIEGLALLAQRGLQPETHILGGGPDLARHQAAAAPMPHVRLVGDVNDVAERLAHRLRVYRLPDMVPVDGGGIPVFEGERARDVMGVALYRRPRDGALFAIVSRSDFGAPTQGYLHQYRLVDDGTGKLRGLFVRAFGEWSGRKEIEALAVDDELGFVYASDETFGVRKYLADPAAEDADDELTVLGREGFARDHEGISIYPTGSGTGYVLVSDQQADTFRIFRREGTPANPHAHEWVGAVKLSTDESDGSEVTNVELPGFPGGLFVAMSTDRTFQFYAWDDIAKAAKLKP